MDLYNLIPNRINKPGWSIKGDYILFNKINNIPLCMIDKGVAYIFLDLRIKKQVFEITQNLIKLNIEFYFTHPEFSNPGQEYSDEKVMDIYLFAYADFKLNNKFKNINFDLLKNLTEWVYKYSDIKLLKIRFDYVLSEVNSNWYDYYSNKRIFDYNDEIREEFRTLWRDIQINQIL